MLQQIVNLFFKETLLFLFLLVGLTLKAQPSGFSFCKTITINENQVEGPNDFIDFPVMFHINDAEFATVARGGHITDSINLDIVFTYNNQILAHEVESYEPTGDLIVWVKVPTLFANTNTVLNTCYGNCNDPVSPEDVFKAPDYQSVLHLSSDPSSTLIDSSPNGNSGFSQGGMNITNSVPGQISNAISFDEIDDAIRINDFDYTVNNGFSLSFWFNVNENSGSDYQYLFSHGSWATNHSLSIYIPETNVGLVGYPDILKTVFMDANDALTYDNLDAGNYVDGNWHYYVFNLSTTGNPTIYIDGVKVANVTFKGGDNFNPNTDIFIAGRSDGNSQRHFGGLIDEFRLMSISRDTNLIRTEYNNQGNNPAFFTIGPESPTGIENFVCPTPLPIELINFTATLNEDIVELDWVTAAEINNDFFTLEKSIDTQNFEAFMFVNGAGNSNQLIKYSEIDYRVQEGITYYRLKQTDYNGESTFSNIVTINKTDFNNNILIYPNPTNGESFNIKIENELEENLILSIQDITGKVCYSTYLTFDNNNSFIITPNRDLSDGVYYLSLTSGKNIYGGKLIIK